MLNLKDPNLLKSKNYINGQWKKGSAGEFDVINPSNDNKVITVANGNAANVTEAVESAALAFKSWSIMPAKERAVLLKGWFDLLIENSDDLGAILTAEQA